MARRVAHVRPRHLRVVLDDDNRAHRPGAFPGWVLIVSVVLGVLTYVACALLARTK